MNAASNSVYQLVVDLDGNIGTNPISFELPEASSVPGTTYKLLIGQIGADAISPAALSRQLVITTSGDQQLLGSIVTTASPAHDRSSGPVISMAVAAGKSATGDQYDLICDGTYWYVTGFIATNGVTYST